MKFPAAALASLLLAACGSSPGNEGAGGNGAVGGNAAGAPAPAPAPANGAATAPTTPATGDQIQAGQWEITGVLRSVEGGDPQRIAAMRRQVGQPSSSRTCISERQARDFASFANRGQMRGCTVADQAYGNGVIRLSASCPAPGGQGTLRMAMQGQYSPTSFSISMNQDIPARAGAPVRISASVSGRRLGPCPAQPTPPPAMRIPSAPTVPVPAPAPAPR